MCRLSSNIWAYKGGFIMSNTKKAVLRALLGFPLGIFISTTILLLVSLGIGDGTFHPAAPLLVADTGGELSAVLWQYIVSGLFGAICGGLSVVWEIESWSLLRQTLVHFLGLTLSMFPIAYGLGWMPERSLGGVLSYILVFVAIYLVLWVALCLIFRHHVRTINKKIQEAQK
jgi:hypothetical protein